MQIDRIVFDRHIDERLHASMAVIESTGGVVRCS